MSELDSTIDLDSRLVLSNLPLPGFCHFIEYFFSSVLSSTKNDSQLETTNNTIVLSSDTETDDTEDDSDEDGEEEGVEAASVSEVVDSSSSGMRELGESTSEATTPGTPLMSDMPSMSQAYVLNSTTEQSSVTSASQLSCDDTTIASSAGATLGDSSITILTQELASHPARLAEVVVEGVGEKDTEEEEKPVKEERKRENSVSEIIEDTFRDKSIAASFGENTSQKEEKEPEEVEPSPSKRKSKGGGEEEECNEEGQDISAVGEAMVGELPAKRQVNDNFQAHKERTTELSKFKDIFNQKVADPDLPSTCTLLISPNTGAKVKFDLVFLISLI